MGLLIKLQNGDTALKSLKFGNDKPGGGDSGQPYIKNPIDKPNTPVLNSDFLLRGGISAPLNAAEDVARLTKYFFDFKNPSGLLFTAKQNLLSRVSPKTEASKGIGYAGGLINAGVYTPLSTLAQAGVVAFGGHLNKQGIDPTGLLPGLSIKKYQDEVFNKNQEEKNRAKVDPPFREIRISQKASNKAAKKLAEAYEQEIKTKSELAVGSITEALPNAFPKPVSNFLEKWDAYRDKRALKKLNRKEKAASRAIENQLEVFEELEDTETGSEFANRLLKLWNRFGLNPSNEFYNPEKTVLRSYSGGPGSLLGIGRTRIRFATLNDGNTPLRTNVSLNKTDDIIRLLEYNILNIIGDKDSSASLRYVDRKDKSLNGTDLFGKAYPPPFDTTTDGRLEISTNPASSTGDTEKVNSKFATWSESDFIATSNPNPDSITTTDFRTILNSDYTKTFLGQPYTNQNNIETLFNLGNPGQKGDLSDYQKGKVVFGTTKALDTVNASYIYKSEINSPARTDGDYRDLIPFNIAILNNETQKSGKIFKKYMHFRAFIKNISDSYSADWDNISYMGRAEKFYKYKGFNRDMSISFTIVAQSVQELTPMFDKLNFLASSLAPEYLDASTSGYMAGNIAYLTIGDYISDQPGIINSLDFEIPEDTTWEIATNRSGELDKANNGERELRMLPHRIEVSMKFTPLHKFRPQKQTFQEDKKNSSSNRLLKPGTAKYIDPLRPRTANYDKEGSPTSNDFEQEQFDIPAKNTLEENIIPSEPNVPITSNPLVRDMGPEVTGLNNLISSNIIFP